jgi:hypothetical protein
VIGREAETRYIIVFVEDPGAAVFVAGLPAAAASVSSLIVRLLAVQPAADFLRARGVSFDELAGDRVVATVMGARPDVLVVGTSENPRTAAFELVHAARAAGVPSVGVVDAAANAAYRFRGETTDPLAHAPDWLLVPDSATHAAFAALNYPTEQIVVSGHPQHETVTELARRLDAEGRDMVRRRVLPDAGDRHVVMFAAEVSTGLNAEQYRRSREYTLHGSAASDDRTSIVLDEFLMAVDSLSERPYLVLRLHPKNDMVEFARYLGAFDHISAHGSPLEAAFAADVVVGMTSMLIMEAALMGVATLSIVPRLAEADWLTAIAAGMTPCATRRDAVAPLLRAALVRGPVPLPDCGEDPLPFILTFLNGLQHESRTESPTVPARPPKNS